MRRLGQIAIFDQRRGGVIALEQRQQVEDRAHLAVRQNRRRGESQAGSGEHIVHFARHSPALVFQPSDPEPDAAECRRMGKG
jgi:hypothetical protein